jgi:hypothetical protein
MILNPKYIKILLKNQGDLLFGSENKYHLLHLLMYVKKSNLLMYLYLCPQRIEKMKFLSDISFCLYLEHKLFKQ